MAAPRRVRVRPVRKAGRPNRRRVTATLPPIEPLSPYFYAWAGDPNYVNPGADTAARRALNRGSSATSGAYTSASAGLTLPAVSGNYASLSSNHSDLRITGDITFAVWVSATDWTPAANQAVIAKWGGAGNRSYNMQILTTGLIRFGYSADGTTIVNTDSSVATGFTDGTGHWIAASVDVDNESGGRSVKFWTSDAGPDLNPTAVTWTQLGTTVTVGVVASFYDSTAFLEFGTLATGSNSLGGAIGKACVYSGSGFSAAGPTGTLVSSTDFRRAITNSFTNTSNQTVTVSSTYNPNNSTGTAQPLWRASSINGRPAWDFVSNDNLAIATASLTAPYTLGAVVLLDTAASQFIFGGLAGSATQGIATTAAPAWSHDYGTARTAGTPVVSTPYLVTSVANGASSKLIVNGSTISTANAGSTALDRITLGANSSLATFLDGKIGFAFAFSGDATTSTAWPAFEAWLRDHYGLW